MPWRASRVPKNPSADVARHHDGAHREEVIRRRRRASCRSTSISHGTAHRPWIAMNEPVPKRAERRDPPEARMHEHVAHARPSALRVPPECVRLGDVRARATRWRARRASVTTERPTNTMRQCAMRSANSIGAVATSAPTPPATMIQPAYDACRSRGYHAAIAFSGAIRHAHTPAPMSARASARPGSVSANANSAAPLAAMASSDRLDAARTEAVEQDSRPAAASRRTPGSTRW